MTLADGRLMLVEQVSAPRGQAEEGQAHAAVEAVRKGGPHSAGEATRLLYNQQHRNAAQAGLLRSHYTSADRETALSIML